MEGYRARAALSGTLTRRLISARERCALRYASLLNFAHTALLHEPHEGS
jgi:hypothetical protein